MRKKLLSAACLCLCLALCLAACRAEDAAPGGGVAQRPAAETDDPQLAAPGTGAPCATITTSLGDITVRLFPEYAPMAVENFTGLAAAGFYGGLPFHRVEPGFLVQTGAGTGGTDATAWGGGAFPVELSAQLHHYTGAVAMAVKQGEGNRSQFYIVQTPADSVSEKQAAALVEAGLSEQAAAAYRAVGGAPELDNTDTVFAQVTEGMEVVDAIAASEEPVTVVSVTVFEAP